MSAAETREAVFLENLLPRYVAEGFTVVMHPSPSILPTFMGRYRPDAIALGPDKKIAIEIKGDSPAAKKAIPGISELFTQHPEWELRVYYVPKYLGETDLKPPTRRAVEAAIEEISELKAAGHLVPAMMMACATLEAIGRKLLPEKLARPQPAAQLVEVLASEGLVTPIEADLLRRAVEMRNAVVHGELSKVVTARRVDEVIASVRLLAALLPPARANG
jgi:uncharacterized protein YutE (UPF0331/DUF86 family)